jgi:hypothetical protein
MRYRAVAVANERTNAVGAVELECTPHGLFVAYLGVGAFSEGYAPGALTSGTGLTVPWSSVKEARLEGASVFLAIEPKLTPLNRLLLVHFTTGSRAPSEELRRRRILVRLGAAASAVCVALIVGATLVRLSPETSAGAAILISAIAALSLVGLGWLVDQRLDDDEGPQALAGFSMELGHYLPALVRLPAAPSKPRPVLDIERLQGMMPRTTFAIVITLSAGALSVLLVARWVTTSDAARQRLEERARAVEPLAVAPPPPPAESTAVAARPSTAPPAASAGGPAAVAGASCRCDRADSLLWAEPIPRLGILRFAERVRRGRGADESHRKQYLELEVAVVNNSKDPIDEVSLLVLFYERDPPPSLRRTQVSNRSLFYEGTLAPGQAIKWSVEAEGTEAEIVNSVSGGIGPNGEDAAPTQRLHELLSARNRPVRLHGAMLLAFLGDPRAKEGTLNLREALRDDEAPYLTRLIQALSEVRVCELRVTGGSARRRASACLFNTGKVPQKDLGLKIRGLEHGLDPMRPLAEPPTVLVEAALPIPGELAPDSGRRVSVELDVGDQAPERYEAVADRFDLLR